MTWWSLVVITAAVGGIVAGQIYLGVAQRAVRHRRSAEHWMMLCAGAAVLGYGLVTVDCVSSGRCFTPQRLAVMQDRIFATSADLSPR